MTTSIGIVDIDMGNLRSVANALSSLGHDPVMVRGAADVSGLTHLILPGVGSYGTAMAHMRERALVEPIRNFAHSGKPLLGICLGMQLLSTTGDEGGPCEGLGVVDGHVRRFDPALVPAIPHVGWNEVRIIQKHPVFRGIKSGVDFYFVHSYRFECARETDLYAGVEYWGSVHASVVGSGNVLGLQFHPEKSQANGLRLLENFCEWGGTC